MTKKKQKAKQKRELEKEKEVKYIPVEPDVQLSPREELSVKDCAKKFYYIMKDATESYVDCQYLHEEFEKASINLCQNPHTLWRIWRQAENDFPCSIDFFPQVKEHWGSKPCGWHYVGPPKYEARKRKKLK